MQTHPSPQSWPLGHGSTVFQPSEAPEALDDHLGDEPLASGQRTRYLASLGAAKAWG